MSSNTEQLEFINHNLCNMKLIGIPGGGKTRTIIEKIISMRNNHIIEKNENFLILTFSRKSREDFLNKGQERIDKLFMPDNVRTIHSVSAIIMRNLFNKTSSNLNTLIAGLYHLLKYNDINFSNVKCLRNCKYIFVDEAQDISDIQYNTIIKISEICEANVIMIGDPDQNIYQFQGGSDKYLIEHSDKCVNLIKNYRSTKNIVNFINQFRPWKKTTPPMISMRNTYGNKPTVYCNNISILLESLVSEIKNSNIPYEEIAIIGPVKKGNHNNYGNHKNFGLQIVAEYFEKNNIDYVPHYNFSDNDNTNRREKNIEQGHINLYTIHGSKGLEFKKVLLLNFHLNTMGRKPTQKKYNEYKYLWYVGLSRAIDEMSIFIESDKFAWTELMNASSDSYKLIGEKPKYTTHLMEEESRPKLYQVTKLLENELFTEEKQYILEKNINCEIKTDVLFDTITDEIFEHDDYSSLYGIFIENIFRYYYEKYRLNDADYQYKFNHFIDSFIKKNNNYLSIPEKHIKTYEKLKKKYEIITINKLEEYKNELDDKQILLYNYLLECNDLDKNEEIKIIKDNGVSIFDPNYIKQRCNNLKNFEKIEKSLFEICVYFYQIEHECGHLLKYNFREHINSLKPYIDNIKNICKQNLKIKKFQVMNKHPNLPIFGVSDAVTDESIIDFKFTKSFSYLHIYQLLLYYNNMYPKWDKKMRLEIWNLYLGKKYTITIDNKYKNYMLNEYLCDTFDIKMKNKIYIYDLETTGLFIESCDIIERYLVDMDDNNAMSSGLINPHKQLPPIITEITGITDDDFCNSDNSISTFKKDIDRIFKLCDMPIFIAHNGNRFDHDILVYKNIINKYNCILLDSREIISVAHNERNLYNKKLGEIYEIIMGYKKENIHRAKEDTDMIIEIFNKINITSDKILTFIKSIK